MLGSVLLEVLVYQVLIKTKATLQAGIELPLELTPTRDG